MVSTTLIGVTSVAPVAKTVQLHPTRSLWVDLKIGRSVSTTLIGLSKTARSTSMTLQVSLSLNIKQCYILSPNLVRISKNYPTSTTHALPFRFGSFAEILFEHHIVVYIFFIKPMFVWMGLICISFIRVYCLHTVFNDMIYLCSVQV